MLCFKFCKLSNNSKIELCFIYAYSGAYAGFLRGGAQLYNFWEFGYTCREAACREQRSCEPLLGGFGACPPKKIFKNGAILCVLRAIFNHFHGKKCSQKIINKHEFFTDLFIMLLPH